MRKLQAKQPITVILLGAVYRARTLRGGRGRVYFRLVETFNYRGDYRGRVPAREEGKTWARGWDSEDAKALKVAWALG